MNERSSDKSVRNDHPCNATGTEDSWVLADWAIEHAYPDIDRKGGGWWGAQRIPNWGILRGAVEAVVRRAQEAPRPSLAAQSGTAAELADYLRETIPLLEAGPGQGYKTRHVEIQVWDDDPGCGGESMMDTNFTLDKAETLAVISALSPQAPQDGTPLLWNVHCMWQQERTNKQDADEWEAQWRELLAAIDQHLVRVGYPNAAPQGVRKDLETTASRVAPAKAASAPSHTAPQKEEIQCCHGGPLRQGCEESNCAYYAENKREGK